MMFLSDNNPVNSASRYLDYILEIEMHMYPANFHLIEASFSNTDYLCVNFDLAISNCIFLSKMLHKHSYDMGRNARKPVFGGLRTAQTQTSLRIRAD